MPGLAGETANLVVALRLDDSGFSGKLNRAARQLQQMDSGMSQMGRGLGQVGSGLLRVGERAAIAAAGGLTAVVTTAASFESAFAGVEKTVDGTDAELEKLEDQFRELARTIPVSFEELSAIGELGGAMGVGREDLIEFTEVVAKLAATTNLTAEDAATSIGQLQNVLGLTGDEIDNFASALVNLGNKGASTESDIVQIAARAGAAGDLIGLTADEVLGFGAAVANLGIEAEAGGSAIQKFFLDTLKNIQDEDLLGIMADTAGTTGEAFKQGFEKDAAGALQTFIEGLGEMDEAAQLAVLSALGFNDVRITRTLLGLAGDTENLADALNDAEQGYKQNTALGEEFQKRVETTAAQWQLFKNNARDALATVGTELLPVVNDLMSEFVTFLNQPGTQENLKAFSKDLAEGVRSLATELKGTDWSGILGGLKLTAEVAKGAFDAFRSLPQPIQQLAIAALVANKVTGGAIGQIAKGLGNLVLGSLKTIMATHVTVVGKTVSGPGGGTPTGGGRGRFPFLPAVLGAATLPLILSGSENKNAQMESDRMKVESGEMTKEEFDRLWNHGAVAQDIGRIRGLQALTNSDNSRQTQSIQALKSESSAKLGMLHGTVSRLANTPHNVNVKNNVNVTASVGVSVLNQYQYRQRTATFFTESTNSAGI